MSAGSTTTLYVLTGDPGISLTYEWQETSFGGGTRVTVEGQTLSVWNADTKLDKLVGDTHSVYTFIDPWSTALTPISNIVTADSIPVRDTKGTFSVSTPTQTNHPATKQYVDDTEDRLQSYISGVEDRVRHLEDAKGDGSSSGGGGGWNTITAPEGVPISFAPGTSEFYEVMLYSAHGVGDNYFTSNVFLFKADMNYVYATQYVIPVGALGVNTADLNFYWQMNVDYTIDGTVYTFTPIYNADPSPIHSTKMYYRAV